MNDLPDKNEQILDHISADALALNWSLLFSLSGQVIFGMFFTEPSRILIGQPALRQSDSPLRGDGLRPRTTLPLLSFSARRTHLWARDCYRSFRSPAPCSFRWLPRPWRRTCDPKTPSSSSPASASRAISATTKSRPPTSTSTCTRLTGSSPSTLPLNWAISFPSPSR